MTTTFGTRTIPLQQEKDGTIRVIGTRIPLDTIIYAYLSGDSAEEIVDSFDSLKLADVYAIIGYYLDQKDELNSYLQKRETEAAQLQKMLEARFPTTDLRQRLLARQRSND
ncbi:MAG: DUF433 domain-containing protein [Anaerolineales bacterium]|nr:DUF433 domain-containing protein [Anaerolineales bacterium]